MNTTSGTNPKWWSEQHTSAWDRIKDALARDWDQTKADFMKHRGQKLNQNVADTVKQAVGAETIPPASVPNFKPVEYKQAEFHSYKEAEPALRYGYGAAKQYANKPDWPSLEEELQLGWSELESGMEWETAKSYVRHGWETGRRMP